MPSVESSMCNFLHALNAINKERACKEVEVIHVNVNNGSTQKEPYGLIRGLHALQVEDCFRWVCSGHRAYVLAAQGWGRSVKSMISVPFLKAMGCLNIWIDKDGTTRNTSNCFTIVIRKTATLYYKDRWWVGGV